MSRPVGLANLDPKAICLIAQAIVAGILTVELDKSLTPMTDGDFFDPEGFMLLEAVRILRPGLLRSLSLASLLGLLTLPLLMLSHLHLLVCCAQEVKKAPSSFSIRGSLDCFPAYFLARLVEWLCLLAFGWLVFHVNATLLSNLDSEITWRTLSLAVIANVVGLSSLLVLLVVADSTKLHAVVLSIDGMRFKTRLKRGIVVVLDNFACLLLGRAIRLCFVVVVSGSLWLIHRTPQFSWWSVAVFSQLCIYLTLSFEAWWYRKMCRYAFSELK